MSHGSALMQTAVRNTDLAAERISRGTALADWSEVPRDLVTLSQQKHSMKVGAALVRRGDEMLGTLVDILA